MDTGNKVIDFVAKKKTSQAEKKEVDGSAPILDMTERRSEIISEERRIVKRTILSEFVGALVVIPGVGLCKCAIYDISENGIAIDLDMDLGHFHEDEEIAMRVYLNQQTYFPFTVKVQNFRGIEDEGCYRHGCSFVKGTINDQALHHFVKFIETVSASLQTDRGDVMVSNINK